MPKELVAIAPRQPALRKYEEPSLEPNQIRINSLFSAEKHGTTLSVYRGASPFADRKFDPELSLFLPKNAEKGWTASFPMKLGNMTVGTITEAGDEVQKFEVGQRVYGYLPIRQTHVVSEEAVRLAPPELSNEDTVCIDPAVVALLAIREGRVRLGDKAAIFGLGAIGLMAVQMASLSGALTVIGVEPIQKRRNLAETYGADMLFSPFECDVGLEIRKITEGKGVDISLDTSGSYRALHEGIRATRYGGTVVPVSWYHGEGKGLKLGEEWHFNRHVLVSGARVESEPYRDYPLWNRERVYETVLQLFRRKDLTSKGMLSPIVRFEEVAEAYKALDEKPEETVKFAVIYD
ncbi:MAG: zinc-binding alcohol dehydrogenase [Candidatus Bathyarchaeota archaeon]|nr:zinc-binding alcohol dehydrogenase [Candidatus Bathyarchaeota archaeon]